MDKEFAEAFKEEIEEASKLPPHLAKFFDKDGNLKKDAADRVAKGREKINWKDGMSTLIFSDFANLQNGHLHTCDIDKNNISAAKKFCKYNIKNITFYIDNSVNFLKNFKSNIDVLYLDSLDGNLEGANEHQLNEIKAAENKIHDNSLVLLDDKLSKCEHSIKYLKQKNYKVLFETDQQILFSKTNK